MMRKALLLCTALLAVPAYSNSLIAPGPRSKIANSTLCASPSGEWNRLSRRDGKNVEIWTLDGDELNKVAFFGGIAVGEPLLRDIDKKNNPLPRVTPNMLITDIPALLESTYRVRGNVVQMTVDTQEPAVVNGHKGVRFTYSFARHDDEVQRKGEAVGAFVKNRLYLVIYEAPALHFFEKDVGKFRQLTDTLRF